ncbi:hypothetical protein MIB92_05865 [Aestuariirhabdus sp. Z084]|uniref:hypothetical protein n=1 Tax=Aestuariirhabdus haliotis TaxID=2918751 RepID=UPI00201B3839|nr:hypothetical protein [Aestuariirhabdus haliotis]MCL6415170.1 hypothetical protein [Aestuariirhabdus haliotis]MCL6420045.1 hypothetical protein [Aestuariirhabdus haliotis]
MSELLTTKTAFEIGRKLFPILRNARIRQQEKRLEEFARCVDLRYEYMSPEDQAGLQNFIESDIGQEKIEKYTQVILESSSQRILMATALLYCQDKELNFNQEEITAFVRGVSSITDETLDLFTPLASATLTDDEYVYARVTLTNKNYEEEIGSHVSIETLYFSINDLIRRGLLLPDPSPGGFNSTKDDWAISYGVSSFTHRVAYLLNKASMMLERIDDKT